MTSRRPDRIPPRGRRATIIRAAADRDLSVSEIVRSVTAIGTLRSLDPSIDRLKTVAAIDNLRDGGFLARGPRGYRATPAGVDLLQHSEKRT